VNPADHATCPQRVTDWGRQLGASTQSQNNQNPKKGIPTSPNKSVMQQVYGHQKDLSTKMHFLV
jgi:hypothetical protein